MDYGLRVRDRQHRSRGDSGPVLQLDVSKLACDPAKYSGRSLWRRGGSRDQCRLAHCMPDFDAVAFAGSARSSDYCHRDLRGPPRALFRKSPIAHRRQTCLSSGWIDAHSEEGSSVFLPCSPLRGQYLVQNLTRSPEGDGPHEEAPRLNCRTFLSCQGRSYFAPTRSKRLARRCSTG